MTGLLLPIKVDFLHDIATNKFVACQREELNVLDTTCYAGGEPLDRSAARLLLGGGGDEIARRANFPSNERQKLLDL